MRITLAGKIRLVADTTVANSGFSRGWEVRYNIVQHRLMTLQSEFLDCNLFKFMWPSSRQIHPLYFSKIPKLQRHRFVTRKPFRAGKRRRNKMHLRNEIWKTISAYAAIINKWENRKLNSISSFLLQPNAIAWAKYGEKSALLYDPIFSSRFYSWWM